MLRTVLSFSLLLTLQTFTNTTHAQDNPDLRSKREMLEKMQEKDIQADLSTFTMAGVDLGVGKNPLASIPATSYGSDHLTFAGDNVTVNITTGTFDPSKHKLNFADKFLFKIDNKGYFGDYGSVPKTTIAAVTATIGADTVQIPAAAIADLYNPSFTYNAGGKMNVAGSVYFSADKKRIYIYLLKQEEGGSYEVTWVIQDKKYLRRVVDFGFLR